MLSAAKTMPPDDLPRFLGELEEIRCTAMARLTTPVPQQPQADTLLDVEETSHRLGVSPGYLYRHHKQLPFARRLGHKLLFSAQGIENYIRQQNVLTPRRKHVILASVTTPTGGTHETSPGQIKQ